ncbi:MAG: FAD-binding oxidoreductase [Pseudomonadota bacterium]
MKTIQVATKEGGSAELAFPEIEALRGELRGELLVPGDSGYEETRVIWNAMIDRRPALIARCRGVADVLAAVKLAARHGLLVAVRGGGHNVAGNAVCDGGLMVDLSPMRSVTVDPFARTARAEGGATWGDFDAETQAFGLATVGGLISMTGVAGLTLGGGIGWLSGSHGLACDNLLSLEVVTAEGKLVRASATENPDLFWGLKGGGGNFGIVTSFQFQLYPVGPSLFAGMLLHPLDKAPAALGQFRDFLKEAPDQLGALAALTRTSDALPVAALVQVYNGPVEDAERLVAPLRAFGPPSADTLGPKPYREIQTLFDAGAPAGLRYYWKSSFLDALPDQAIEILAARHRASPSPKSKIFVEFLGGAMARVDLDATVFDHRASPYNLLIIGAWQDPSEDRENIAWVRETWNQMQPYASPGVYMNYLGQESDEGRARVEASYGPGKLERLAKLKAKYDPTNLFRMNQNIRPAP